MPNNAIQFLAPLGIQTPEQYPPVGAPWTWTVGAGGPGLGIAGINSLFVINNPPGADGDFVLFVRSSATRTGSSVTIPFEFPLANNANLRDWRLSFLGAQRLQTTGADRQVVRVEVTVGGTTTTVFEDPMRDQTFRRHVTRPFRAPASTAGTVSTGTMRISGLANTAAEQMAFLDRLELRQILDFTVASNWNQWPTTTDVAEIRDTGCMGLRTGQALSTQVGRLDVKGELFILDQGGSLILRTTSVEVHSPTAFLQVGTEGLPFVSVFELRLDDVATRLTTPTPHPERQNGLWVHDCGQVDLHGVRRTAWMRAESASSNLVEVATNPGWVAGDEVVVPSGTRRFDQAEVRQIAAVGPGNFGRTLLTLNSGLQYLHAGIRQQVVGQLSSPLILDQRPEVGLLTHNVKVTAEPRSSGVPELGGHIMIEDRGPTNAPFGPTGVDGGFGRFSNVEMKNLGREGQSGRYPLHWHFLLGQGRGQFAKRCSIRNSNNRVVALHATDGVLFEGNVAYRHPGHGVFIEDGGEEDNQFIGNLVLGTRLPTTGYRLLLSDAEPLERFQNRAPASFWITNPNNVFADNVAAGSEGCGYWFALPEERMGRTATLELPGVNSAVRNHFNPGGTSRPGPARRPLGSFTNNVCHSAWLAIDINDGILPDTQIRKNLTWQPHDSNGQRVVAQVEGFVTYCCNVGLYTGNGDHNLRFSRALVSDTTWSVALASHDLIEDSAIVLDSGLGLWPAAAPSPPLLDQPSTRSAVILYDGAGEMRNVSLFGYDVTSSGGSAVAAFRTEGAARRRNGIPYSGYYCFATLASNAPVWLNVSGIQDAGAVPPGGYPTNDYRDPRHWAFSIDNWDLSMGTLPSSTEDPIVYSTIVPRHPMMLTGNESGGSAHDEIDLPLSGSPARLLYSPHKFAYVRVFRSRRIQGQSAAFDRHGDLRYDREVGSPMRTLTYMDRWVTDPYYHQMALIADRAGENNGFRYRMSWWSHAGGTPAAIAPPRNTAQFPDDTEVQVSGLQPGESVLIGLSGYATSQAPPPVVQAGNGYDEFGNPTFGVTVPVVALSQLGPQIAQTSMAFDIAAGVVWVRVRIPNSPQLVNLQHDGVGQALRVLQ